MSYALHPDVVGIWCVYIHVLHYHAFLINTKANFGCAWFPTRRVYTALHPGSRNWIDKLETEINWNGQAANQGKVTLWLLALVRSWWTVVCRLRIALLLERQAVARDYFIVQIFISFHAHCFFIHIVSLIQHTNHRNVRPRPTHLTPLQLAPHTDAEYDSFIAMVSQRAWRVHWLYYTSSLHPF